MNAEIWVMGSAICDLVFSVDKLPSQGETVLSKGFAVHAGGKGANQAVAAARLGASTHFIGKVGNDSYGEILRQSLESAGVRAHWGFSAGETGCASILVDSQGQNQIVVNPGANHLLGETEVFEFLKRAHPDDFLLLQHEMTEECNVFAASIGLRVILNPAPASSVTHKMLGNAYAITPNELEAHHLTGVYPATEEDCRLAGLKLLALGIPHVVITLGERGCYYTNGAQEAFEPAPKVDVVDTVGAGDAFNGALAAALARGDEWTPALRFANKAAAFSVTRVGAQASMATLAELDLA